VLCCFAHSTDVKDIAYVINYDMPNGVEDYIHRIGRTGRAGRTGIAYSYFAPDGNGKLAREIIEILEKAKQVVPPQLRELASFGGGGGRSRGGGGGNRWGGGGGRSFGGGTGANGFSSSGSRW